MFGISGVKLMMILIAGLILIGPDKMPDIARTIGKALKMFNAAKEEMERSIKGDMLGVEDTTKLFNETGESLAATLYNTPSDDEDEEEEEE